MSENYEINKQLIDKLILLQRSSIKVYIVYTAVIVGIGAMAICIGQAKNIEGTLKTLMTSGGTVIASFGGFSLKEYLNKIENIRLFKTLQATIEIYKENIPKQQQIETALQQYLIKNN